MDARKPLMDRPRFYTFIRDWTDDLLISISGEDPSVAVVELNYATEDPLADAQERAMKAAAEHYEMTVEQFEAETVDVMTIFCDISEHIEIGYVKAVLL